ncbi:MAG TPA: hypothetical protein PLQ56_18400 [Aggregatilineales bacterium]|nr:hypothetical protein [Aggregatilineales bacterium]
MKKLRLVGLLLLILLIGAFNMVQAQEEEAGNACETGGLIEGKCTTEWHWVCGWYLQQWEKAGGWYGTYAFPDWCDPISLLPPKPEVKEGATATSTGCYTDNSYWSFYYSGTSGTEITWYEDNLDCSGTPDRSYPDYGIEAPDYDTAMDECSLLTYFPYVWNPNQEEGYNSPSNLWICTED